jgi:transcriptional regulator with XRE-family HTH domain
MTTPLKALKDKHGLTVTQLAIELGYSRPHLSEMLSGRSPTPQVVTLACKWLDQTLQTKSRRKKQRATN